MSEQQAWPALRPKLVPLSSLLKYAGNANKHSDEQVKRIAAAIERWGFTMPILAGEDGTVIAGHARLEAAKFLGLEQVPVVRANGWSDEQKRAYCIADNRLAQISEWDDVKLRLELSQLAEHDAINDIGFDQGELDDLLRIAHEEAKVSFTGKPIAKPVGKSVVSDVLDMAREARIGREAIPITEAEENIITALLHFYVKQKSIKNGFFLWLLGSKKSA